MTNGLVFVLHSSAAKVEAAELAAELAPLVALPMVFADDHGARHVAYGGGATCVILWDQHLVASADVLARCAPSEGAFICTSSDVALPGSLTGHAVIDRRPTFVATAAALREAIANRQRESVARAARPRRATPSLATKGVKVHESGKDSMMMRSAWGLAATVAVASIAAPVVGDRAGASSMGAEFVPSNGASESVELPAPDAEAGDRQSAVEPPPMVELIAYLDETAAAVSQHSATEPTDAAAFGTARFEEVAVSDRKSELPAPVAAVEEPKAAAEPLATGLTQKPEAQPPSKPN